MSPRHRYPDISQKGVPVSVHSETWMFFTDCIQPLRCQELATSEDTEAERLQYVDETLQ